MPATFEPAQPAGAMVPGLISAVNAGQSYMARAQQMKEERDRQQEQDQLKPLMIPYAQAKLRADTATALASLDTAKRQQDLRTQSAIAAPQAQDEYLTATQIADVGQRAAALDAIAGKYSWLGNLPENKGFLDAVNNARGTAHAENLVNLKLTEAQQIATDRLEALQQTNRDKAQLATELQASKAETERYKAQLAAGAHVAGAQIGADARVQSAKLGGEHTYELEKMVRLRDEALANGDSEIAGVYDSRIKKLNNIPVSAGEALNNMVNAPAAGISPAVAPKAIAPVTSVVQPSTVIPATPNPTQSSVKQFGSIEEAKKAFSDGTLKPGDRVIVGGQSGVWK